MCDNRGTWMYNILLVAVTLLTVTAPFIPNVVCMVNGISAHTTADAVVDTFALRKLTKRDVVVVSSTTGNTDTADNGLRVPKNREVDFDAYINEFKMQDEASIPEDILDQQHIQDEDSDVPYATESEATDIVFESERLSPKNFTTHDIPKTNNDYSSIYTKDDTKMNVRETNYDNPNSEKSTNKRDEYYDDIAIVGDELATEDDDDNFRQSMDLNTGSNVYKKFKRIKSDKNGDEQQREPHEQQQKETQNQKQKQHHHQHEHQEQLGSIVKLNERKFNKGSVKESNPVKETMKYGKTSKFIKKINGEVEDKDKEKEKENRQEKEDEVDDNNDDVDGDGEDDDGFDDGYGSDVAAAKIGDIQDNFRNEDGTLAAAAAAASASASGDDYGNNDRDKSVDATILPNVAESEQRSISVSETGGQMLTSTLVGRKTKRFNRVRTFNSGDRQQQQQQQEQQSPQQYKPYWKVLMNDDMENGNGKGKGKTNQHQRTEIVEDAKFQNDYAIKNYGITAATAMRNGSHILDDDDEVEAESEVESEKAEEEEDIRNIQNSSGQLQYRNEKENVNNGKTEQAEQAIFKRKGNGKEQKENRQQPEQEQVQHEETETSKSAFEQHKARRRNNRRYGHKSHKKRYKDYLRFAMTPLKITTTTKTTTMASIIDLSAERNTSQRSRMSEGRQKSAAIAAIGEGEGAEGGEEGATSAKLTNNSERNYEKKHEIKEESENFNQYERNEQQHVEKLKKYAKKFETEKSRELPASPIFVVANRNSVISGRRVSPTKPFYEGQINYYMETKDDEQDTGMEEEKGEEDDNDNNNSKIQADTINWYRRVSPVLRNGIKTSLIEGNEPPSEHRRKHHHHHNHHYHHHYPHIQQQQRHHDDYKHNENYNHRKHEEQEEEQHHQHQHQQEFHQHQHHSHHKHHKQTNKHYQSAQSNPYQRKFVVKKPLLGNGIASPLYSTPIPPPSYKHSPHSGAMQELGHQITEMDELERYYAKWPHLARVQLQVYDEHFRELHPELYPDYDQDYESAAELEEAQNDNSEDANLPPYIKKYNRRNKQLLNLLEGTLAPPIRQQQGSFSQGHFSSILQPGPHESNSGGGFGGGGGATIVRIDDDYMKEKRRRYHNRYGNKNNNQNNGFQYDLFAEQRAALNANDSKMAEDLKSSSQQTPTAIVATPKATTTTTMSTLQNKIPGEDVSITRDEEQNEPNWHEEIEMKSNGNSAEMTGNVQMTWQIEKLTTPSAGIAASGPTSSSSSADKSILFRLPSYPAISGGFIGKPRSRSAQFAPSSSSSISSMSSMNSNSNSRGNSFINMHRDYHNFQKTRHMAIQTGTATLSTVAPELQISKSADMTSSSSSGSLASSASKGKAAINTFVYHRVVDSAPRFVGAGSTGLKQRLPFVAITDRRLETAKKTLTEHKQDLEQNFYPMP